MLYVLFDYGWNVTLCIGVGLAQVRMHTSWVLQCRLLRLKRWYSQCPAVFGGMLASCDMSTCKCSAACRCVE